MDRRTDMMVVHFKDTFPFRVAEWFMAVVMITWAIVLFNPDFDAGRHASFGFAAVFDFTRPHQLGYMLLTFGFVRFLALLINGLWWRTPAIRLVMAFICNLFWVELTLSIITSGKVTTGLAVYPWFVVLEVYSAFRAAYDLRVSRRTHKARSDKGGVR